MFKIVGKILTDKNLIVRDGTCVDATIIDASGSTKNKKKKRDPEMSSTKKGTNYRFGMKVHTGVDAKSKLIHTVKTSSANVHDSQMFEECLHGEEKAVFADKAYVSAEKKRKFRESGKYWGVQEKATKTKKLSNSQKKPKNKLSQVWSRTSLFDDKASLGHKSVRYKGLRKNSAQFFSLCFLANLY